MSKKEEESKEIVQISKIKFDGKEVKIEYSRQIKEGEYVACSFKSDDLPHIDFINALENLTLDFMDILELPEGYEDDLELRGLSIKISDFLVKEGVTITGLKKLNSGKCVCLNTPYLEINDESEVVSKITRDKISHLEKEAFAFIEGKRKNQQLKLVS